MRADATATGDARRRVQQLLTELPEGDEQLSFSQPWQLRAFALAVAAYDSGQYDWSEFQLALIAAIRQWERGEAGEPWHYYDRWLEALETMLSGTGVLSGTELDDQAHVVATTPPDRHDQHARREPVAIDPAR